MSEYRLRPQAERDLQDIWIYSASRWSEAQADKYLRLIGGVLEDAAAQPLLGARADLVSPGLRRRSVGSHVIFYKSADYGADIVRVLHQSMNSDAILDSE